MNLNIEPMQLVLEEDPEKRQIKGGFFFGEGKKSIPPKNLSRNQMVQAMSALDRFRALIYHELHYTMYGKCPCCAWKEGKKSNAKIPKENTNKEKK